MDVTQVTGDPRFFQRTGPHSLAAVVDAADAKAAPRRILLYGVAPLHAATADEVSFLDNRKYLPALEKTNAGAVIVHPDHVVDDFQHHSAAVRIQLVPGRQPDRLGII